MVIISTSAEEVIIQAVSPESNFGTAANAGAPVSAKPANAPPNDLKNVICRPPMLLLTPSRTAGLRSLLKKRAVSGNQVSYCYILYLCGYWNLAHQCRAQKSGIHSRLHKICALLSSFPLASVSGLSLGA